MSNLLCVVDLTDNEIGVSVGLVDDNNLFNWNVIFEGPEGTVYEVSFCNFEMLTIVAGAGWLLQGWNEFPRRFPEQSTQDEIYNANVASEQ